MSATNDIEPDGGSGFISGREMGQAHPDPPYRRMPLKQPRCKAARYKSDLE